MEKMKNIGLADRKRNRKNQKEKRNKRKNVSEIRKEDVGLVQLFGWRGNNEMVEWSGGGGPAAGTINATISNHFRA